MLETRATSDSNPDSDRKLGLIRATQSIVAEAGPSAATVRAISARAGVTQGLIRHYFGSKDGLLRAAYTALIDGMTEKSRDALEGVGAEPVERLAIFIATALRPPLLDAGAVGLWGGYLHRVRADSGFLRQHESSYLSYRDLLEALIAALDRPGADAAQLRAEAVACNAVIDGLWLEGSLLTESFASGELVRIALHAIGRILDTDLFAHTTFIPELLQGPRPVAPDLRHAGHRT